MFEIQKNVPIPTELDGRGRKASYPFATMEIGDSFYVDSKKKGINAMNAARVHKHRNGMKFLSQPEGEGSRIWRTE